MFITIIDKIYKKYIEINKAPFEINISFEIREKIRTDYTYIKQNFASDLNGEINILEFMESFVNCKSTSYGNDSCIFNEMF